MKRILFGTVTSMVLATTGWAETIRVVTDIAPVHSLVARVMAGAGEPELLLRGGESPHDFAMRPSNAKALQSADAVIWMGPPLIPGLEQNLATLADQARILDLSEAQGIERLMFREEALFEADDHDDHEAHDDHDKDHDDGKHEHGDDHGDHDDHDNHDDHADAHDTHGHDHDHDGLDPHMWLDPENAQVWLGVIAGELASLDPENAALYEENATAAQAELAAVTAQIEERLSPVRSQPYVVFHDAYQYFEHRFELNAAGSILISDASAPSAARLDAIRDRIQEADIVCVFSEPQFDDRVVQAVAEGIRTAQLDPTGFDLDNGADLYPQLLLKLTDAFVDCLRD